MVSRRAKKTRRAISFWLGTIIILTGIFLVLFFFLNDLYHRYYQATSIHEEPDIEQYPVVLPEAEMSEKIPDSLLPGEGRLEIPVLDLHLNVGYGVEPADLRDGPGFYPQSGCPDEGNVSIAGHRTARVFLNLNKLKYGDEIILHYNDNIYYYYVDEVFITHSRDWDVIAPTSTAALTLTTCEPAWEIRPEKRLIVRAYLSDIVTLK